MSSVPLSGVEVLRVCTVLQDSADQMAILGNMPDTYKKGRSGKDQAARQMRLEAGGLLDSMRELPRSQKLNRTLEEKPLASDNLAKIQRDRQFVAQVISGTLVELQESGLFSSLLLAVEEEKKQKARLLDVIIREEEGRRRTKVLQRQLLDIKKDKTPELQQREKMIAHLKDQLQEMKARTGLERKCVESGAELLVYQGQKLNARAEKELEDEIRLLHEKLDDERRAHVEISIFLKEHQIHLTEKREMWMENYERDTEDKQQELISMKNTKADNLSTYQELSKKYRTSEKVIMDYRQEKEQLRRQLEREQLEQDAATKIQSWWRGTLVRRGLGPYNKGKKPKKGKKGGKKGKKNK